MRDPNRLEPLYNYLKEVHSKRFPDWRFFQFIDNFKSWLGCDTFYIEDDKVEELMEKFIKEI